MVCTLRDSSCQLFGKRNKRQKKQFSIGSPKALDFSSEKGPGLRCAPFAKNIFIRMLSNDSGAASNHPRVMPAPSRTSCFLNFIFWYPAIRRHETPLPSLTPLPKLQIAYVPVVSSCHAKPFVGSPSKPLMLRSIFRHDIVVVVPFILMSLRLCFPVLCDFPACALLSMPLEVNLKRFFAELFVFTECHPPRNAADHGCTMVCAAM